MGMRLVLMMNMDSSSQWSKDPELGMEILRAAMSSHTSDMMVFDYGKVVEVTHASTTSLAKLYQGYEYECLVADTSDYLPDNLSILKRLADDMGYRVSRKPRRLYKKDLVKL